VLIIYEYQEMCEADTRAFFDKNWRNSDTWHGRLTYYFQTVLFYSECIDQLYSSIYSIHRLHVIYYFHGTDGGLAK